MLWLASELAFKVRFLNNNFQPACCTWSRPYFCSFKNWILKYGKYSECEAALSKALITELLKEHYTIDAVANFDSLCHGVRIAIDRELHDWLDLSLNHTVPSSLLILSRAFYASGEASPEKAGQATLSFLPDKIVDTVGVTTLPLEDSVLGSRRKLEFLEMQEEPIKEEEEELAKMKDSVSSQKGVTLEEMSHPTAKEAQEQAIPKTLEKYEQLCELSRAYPLAKTSASSVSQGCREFLKLANKVVSPEPKFVPAMHHCLVSSMSLARNFSSKSQGNVLGIDLGTTYSRVAVMQGEDPVVIEEVEGGRYTKKSFRSMPSVVFFKPNGESWVGRQANMMTSLYPSRALFDTKHLVGTVYDSSKVQTSLYPKIVRGFKGEAWVETEFGIFSPAKIQAFILAKMRAIGEVYLKESATKAVISVPACFNEAQREAIKYAGDIAGLDIQGVVEDPVAAALAYGLDKRDGLFAVYSFGGTFEFSILEISNGVIKVKAKRKSLSHGGLDFDLLLVRHLWKEFTRCHAFDASHYPLVLQRFLGAAERAKVRLSSEPQVEVKLHNLLNIQVKKSFVQKDLEVTITRSEFESLVSELIEETGAICQKCLEVANITRKDLDGILVVGGLGCVPSVREYMELFFGKSPLKSPRGVTPDEAVVIGAAIHGEKFR